MTELAFDVEDDDEEDDDEEEEEDFRDFKVADTDCLPVPEVLPISDREEATSDKVMISWSGTKSNAELRNLGVDALKPPVLASSPSILALAFTSYSKSNEKLFGRFKEFRCLDFFRLLKLCPLVKAFRSKVSLKELEANI